MSSPRPENDNTAPEPGTGAGRRLAETLRESTLTQTDLARMSGVSESHLSKVICGHRPLSKPITRKIVSVLRVSASFLLFGEEDPRHRAVADRVSEAPNPGYDAIALTAWQYCPRCGVRIRDDWRFCASCGAVIAASEHDIDG